MNVEHTCLSPQLFSKPAEAPRVSKYQFPSTKTVVVQLLLAILVGVAASASAQDLATAQLNDVPLGGGAFDYTLTLENTGTNNLGTFWDSWTPGKDFLPSRPTNIVSPANWTAKVTYGGMSDGFAIQWTPASLATPSPLTPGSTLTFSFDSTDAPNTLMGSSPSYPTTSVGASFVYGGAPFSDAGDRFVVNGVPEPSTAAAFCTGLLAVDIAVRRGANHGLSPAHL